ncbi:Acyl-CoA synthetase (AMP-forming)/AMP-acid ligase II [Thermomonospora echinospora]|uniref:Acyl-CoA synthetase (AMP-forming)/AMP-acid ligase II n=1 Tax=Thermomonospora echinospora TaxID=1992 RepID=A0A1H6DVP3_9ACTN|nr:fatty acid--CoA ligase family protein [Thermomonospora echinospora]SEG88655.1 Acyl-CoA synthetase (AMP-forming)/AMP-acid ligase II [Thermomonospora echinospora]
MSTSTTETSTTGEPGPSLPELLLRLHDTGADVPAVDYQGSEVTWGELRELGEAAERELDVLGLGEGARVGVVLGNRPESVGLAYLTLSTGRCLTVFNPLQPAERLTADVLRTRPPVLFAPADLWEFAGFAEAAARAGLIGFAAEGRSVRRIDLPAVDGASSPVRAAPGVAVELSTSGTTGPPKRIPLAYRQIEAALGSVDGHMTPGKHERAPFTGGVVLITTPMVHIGGMWGVIQALVEARRMVVLPRFTVDAWREVIRAHRPRLAGLPPAAMRGVLNADVPAEDLASLRAVIAGTAPTPPELIEEFQRRYDVAVLVMYGATEFSGAVAGWSLPLHRQWWERKKGSVGRPFPGVGLRITDEDGNELPVGDSGVLEIRTAQAGDGTWTRTSDLAHIDADGFLWIEGRADDVIIRGGFKVHPPVVAAALERHPAVAEAAVAALPDERLGQVPVAAFEVRPGAEIPDAGELRAWCRRELLPYEVPVRFLHVTELPRGVSQKVSRVDLLALFGQ